jgi:hypothetical protein
MTQWKFAHAAATLALLLAAGAVTPRAEPQTGLTSTPWTFRASVVKGYAKVTDEMRHFLAAGVDGVITDNPDLAP